VGEQEGNADLYSNVSILDLTLVSRPKQNHQSHHNLPRLLGRRQRHLAGRKNLHRLQETSLHLHRDQHPLSTFRRRQERHCRGSGQTWYRTMHNPCHQHPQAMTLDSSSRRFLQPDLVLKRQRDLFAVDMLMSSNNQHHLHHHRRLLHFR
jgi:hypothetical protein